MISCFVLTDEIYEKTCLARFDIICSTHLLANDAFITIDSGYQPV